MDEREASQDIGMGDTQSPVEPSEPPRPPHETGLSSLPAQSEPGRLPIGKRPVVPLWKSDAENVLNALFAIGNLMHAAKVLGIDRRTMYRKIEMYGFQDWREWRKALQEKEKGEG